MHIDPCINPKTNKIFDWENPNFTPGKHCTKCRFNELPEPKFKDFPFTCATCIESVRAWKIRSDRAKLAAIKRRIRK